MQNHDSMNSGGKQISIDELPKISKKRTVRSKAKVRNESGENELMASDDDGEKGKIDKIEEFVKNENRENVVIVETRQRLTDFQKEQLILKYERSGYFESSEQDITDFSLVYLIKTFQI